MKTRKLTSQLVGNLATAALAMAIAGGAQAAQTMTSSFIDGLPPLEPSPFVQGAFRWQKAGVDFGSYDKVMLDRVHFVYATDSESKTIDPSHLAAIGASLVTRIREAMEPEYPVVDASGPGVLRLRLAITEVRVMKVEGKKVAKGIFAITPVGLALNALTSGAAEETDLSRSRIEAEALDSASGTRLGVFIDPEPARHGDGGKSWEALQESFSFYASRLRSRFDREHGR